MAQPVQVDGNIFSITGGHLGNKELIVKAELDTDGISFTTIDRTTSRFRVFLGGNYAMMDHMIKLRNEAVDRKMGSQEMDANDPMHAAGAAAPDGAGGLQRKRREVFGDLEDDTVEINPVSEGGEVHSVRVRPHWYKRAKLTLQVTQANFELLLQQPHDSADSFRPIIMAEGVTWNKSRSCVWLAWFDGSESHTKSYKVTFGQGWTNAEKQAEVDRVVQDLLVWYDNNNVDAAGVDAGGGGGQGAAGAAEGHNEALLASQEDKA